MGHREDLDAALARDGEIITLQRLDGQDVAASVNCAAFVRGYAPAELIGGITEQDSRVILSPTEIIAAGWQSFVDADTDQDKRVPVKDNKVVVAGKTKNVEAGGGIYVAAELVRIELRVRG